MISKLDRKFERKALDIAVAALLNDGSITFKESVAILTVGDQCAP